MSRKIKYAFEAQAKRGLRGAVKDPAELERHLQILGKILSPEKARLILPSTTGLAHLPRMIREKHLEPEDYGISQKDVETLKAVLDFLDVIQKTDYSEALMVHDQNQAGAILSNRHQPQGLDQMYLMFLDAEGRFRHIYEATSTARIDQYRILDDIIEQAGIFSANNLIIGLARATDSTEPDEEDLALINMLRNCLTEATNIVVVDAFMIGTDKLGAPAFNSFSNHASYKMPIATPTKVEGVEKIEPAAS